VSCNARRVRFELPTNNKQNSTAAAVVIEKIGEKKRTQINIFQNFKARHALTLLGKLRTISNAGTQLYA